MIDLNTLRHHKQGLLFLIHKNGLERLDFSASLYAATTGCKIIACYCLLAEEFGDIWVIGDTGQTISQRIESLCILYQVKRPLTPNELEASTDRKQDL